MVSEINMLKQLSDSFAASAAQSEKAIRTGDCVDKHMDMDLVLETMRSLDKKYSVDL